MNATEIAPGLWRWTAAHPEWRPGAARDSPADWEREVGSALWLHGGAASFVDALVPEPEQEFWDWADELVGGCERAVALTTIKFHRRNLDAIVARYRAATSRAEASLPEGIETVPLRGAGEVCFWLAPVRTLIAGDRLLGDGDGGLRLCPESWLGYLGGGMTRARLRELLAPLLKLPIERVLVSHGEPVLHDGRAAIAAALETAR